MLSKFIPFLILGIIILFGAHLIVYHFIIRFFSITADFWQNILIGGLIFLSLSFFLASLIAHWKDNFLMRAFYFLSASWLGFLVNLILAIAIGWTIYYFICLAGYRPNLLSIGIIILLSAITISGYGIYNAFNPVIKKMSVKIKNLPEEWKNKKIAQISDVHLGHIYRAEFLQKLVDKLNEIKPETVMITGDLFDGMDGSLDTFVQPLKKYPGRQNFLCNRKP
ncbi:MAG: metallophosphoesterase [bacterium]